MAFFKYTADSVRHAESDKVFHLHWTLSEKSKTTPKSLEKVLNKIVEKQSFKTSDVNTLINSEHSGRITIRNLKGQSITLNYDADKPTTININGSSVTTKAHENKKNAMIFFLRTFNELQKA